MSDIKTKQIIKAAGGQARVAGRCGVTQQAVSRWCVADLPIPAKHVLAVEALQGAYSRYQIRPDIYGPAPVDLSKSA